MTEDWVAELTGPRSADAQHAAAQPLWDISGTITRQTLGTQGAVLVVDDYGDIREIVADLLQNAGFIVRTAADGVEALLAAYEMRPSVIVMDVSMPVLDGLEATRLIKACAVTRDARASSRTPAILRSTSLRPGCCSRPC